MENKVTKPKTKNQNPKTKNKQKASKWEEHPESLFFT
jgi:hypothetical protein